MPDFPWCLSTDLPPDPYPSCEMQAFQCSDPYCQDCWPVFTSDPVYAPELCFPEDTDTPLYGEKLKIDWFIQPHNFMLSYHYPDSGMFRLLAQVITFKIDCDVSDVVYGEYMFECDFTLEPYVDQCAEEEDGYYYYSCAYINEDEFDYKYNFQQLSQVFLEAFDEGFVLVV